MFATTSSYLKSKALVGTITFSSISGTRLLYSLSTAYQVKTNGNGLCSKDVIALGWFGWGLRTGKRTPLFKTKGLADPDTCS